MNPYAAPATPREQSAALPDSSDLFVQTLPPPVVRAAGFSAMVTGVLMWFLCFRFVLNAVTGTFVTVSEMMLIACGILQFVVAWGVTGGRLSTCLLGLALTPVVASMSLFALVTGSIAGLFGGALVVLNAVLLAASFGPVRRIGIAREALRRSLSA